MVSAMKEAGRRVVFDLERQTVRDLNQFLHGDLAASTKLPSRTRMARTTSRSDSTRRSGSISTARGLLRRRHEQEATVVVHGNAGPGLGENMMSGRVE